MRIASIDHIVLTVADLQRTLDFYVRVLGMREIDFANGRKALAFGSQKINLHVKGEEIFPNALNANVGTADICLLTDTPLESVLEELEAAGIAVEQGGGGAANGRAWSDKLNLRAGSGREFDRD